MTVKATYENPHTFEEAVQWLRESHWIDYEVTVGFHQGALLTRETWLEAVVDGSFVDYDGRGDQLTAEGKFVGGGIHPSQASKILPETRYILWYNR